MKRPEDAKLPDDWSATERLPTDAGASLDRTVATPDGRGSGTSRSQASTMALTLTVGAVVAGRYRLERFIAKGGMGEVYEAEDLALGTRVALKTIRPDIAGDASSVARFKREITVARQVTHRSVCRLYDLGTHVGDGGDQTLFLTMELLAGETLSQRLAKVGRLATDVVLGIARQLAAGLDAAHDAGIIHRDFKSANIMLVPSRDGAGERVVITDFGLARGEPGDGGLASISEVGAVVGTPAYMAPEQVEGRELTGAADLYAFGVVLYEMVTARRPFEGGSALSIASRRLTEAPRSPSEIVPDLDPRWSAVILRCLARDPAGRFATAGEVVAALVAPASSTVSAPQASADDVMPVRRGRAWQVVAVTAAAVGLALAGWFGVARLRPAAPAGDGPAMTARTSVAVLGIADQGGRVETAWLATAVAEVLRTELVAAASLRVVGGEVVAEAMRTLPSAASLAPAVLDRAALRQVLGTDFVVVGSYRLMSGDDPLVALDLHLVDLSSGEVVSGSATGSERQVVDLVDRASGSLWARLGVEKLAAARLLEVAASFPEDPAAARAVAEGISHLRRSEFVAACADLETAIAAAPDHPVAYLYLSDAQWSLGRNAAAAEAAAKAAERAAGLPRREQKVIQARSQERAGDLDGAVATYREVLATWPDDLDVGVRLAATLSSAGRSREALAVVAALRELPAPLASDPRIGLTEAWAHADLGDFAAAESAALAVEQWAASVGVPLLGARAQLTRARALQTGGNLDQAMTVLTQAKEVLDRAGDRRASAECLEMMGITVWMQGDLSGAARLLERALAADREQGLDDRAARVLLNLGALAVKQGRVVESERYLAEALAVFERTGDRRAAARALQNRGATLLGTGELTAAARSYQLALDAYSALGERNGVAMCLTNIGELRFLEGRLAEAGRLHEEALAIDRELGDKDGGAYDTFRLALVAFERGDDFLAERGFGEALAAQEGMGNGFAAAETRIGLARLALDRGDAARAEEAARQAAQVLRSEQAVDLEAMAQAVLGTALAAQGQVEAARATLARVRELAATVDDPRVQVATAALALRVEVAARLPAASQLTTLEQAVAAAEGGGNVLDGLGGRLVLLEVRRELGGGPVPEAIQLVERAEALGLGRIATRGRALLGS